MADSPGSLTLFLDTCALLYLAADSDRLSAHARMLLDECATVSER